MKCGEVRASTRPGKKVMKKYCLPGGKEKLVHAGAKGGGDIPSPTLWPRCGRPPPRLGNNQPRLTFFSLFLFRSRRPQGYGNNYSSKVSSSRNGKTHPNPLHPFCRPFLTYSSASTPGPSFVQGAASLCHYQACDSQASRVHCALEARWSQDVESSRPPGQVLIINARPTRLILARVCARKVVEAGHNILTVAGMVLGS